MDKGTVVKLVRAFGEKLLPELPIDGIWLYGSWVYGTPHEDSDIDVAVTLSDQTLDLLETGRKLFHLRRDIDYDPGEGSPYLPGNRALSP